MTITTPWEMPTADGSVKSRRWLHVLIAVTVLLCAVTASVFVTSATSAGRSSRSRTIHLQTTLVSATRNAAGLGGAGDVVANLNSFQTSSGTTGHADIICQIFPNSEQECLASFVFANGQIDASAAITLPATSFTAPITGGSGAYEGVSGHIDNKVVSPGVIDRTFHLIFGGADD
jgi:hypothetical protein